MSVGARAFLARRTKRPECGAVGGVEMLIIGIVLFVGGSLFLANLWAVIDAKMAVTTAAREAAREAVEGAGTTGAAVSAGTSAYEALRAHERVEVTVTFSGGFRRCHRAIAKASTTVAVIGPLPGRLRHVRVRATHTEIVDPYRSGIAGAVDCV